MSTLNSIKSMFMAMRRSARIGLGIGVAVIMLATVLALWLVFSSRQELLFGNLSEADAAEIASTLGEWKVPYSLSDNGTGIMVDSAQMLDTRMRLVSAGIPKGGHVGYELFDDNEFGVTEFAQRINYQRALQGELERTVASISGVQNVRVHLSIRRAGSFLGEDASSKASVALTLQPGTSLARRQVAGIRNLVASAVEGLSPAAVVVVGPAGLQLAGGGQADAGSTGEGEGADAASDMSARIQARVEQLLSEALHGQRASVSVDVRLNFDKVHRTLERPVALSGTAQGIVVRRSNSGGRPVEGAGEAALINEQIEYAHGTEREEVTRAVGAIERISVAVVLPSGVAAAERERLVRLVSVAAGLDTSRGDSIEMGNAAELPSTPAAVAPSVEARAMPAKAGVMSLWPARSGPIWALLGFLLGVIAAVMSIMWRRRAGPLLLTKDESERAALQVQAWLKNGTH
ncbi:flagellar M-ring protein FliF [Stenotrophomonas sp. MYb238]|uniref:flagellar basal-body MS-ring/collar protein FliF n=1 Tax=Stenotrophomonas sp. MYb238 TaxID=2040281 RepID=UPI0012929B5E|nr:flagellar basal-body MS-ring/collar protein FliF [Stenotrophomonas sp. MYb238]MQP74728.1 flagellar M-ring protein FliF [Stenotrophomonas sp. MYb238]